MHDVSLILILHAERTKAFQMILYNDSLHKSYDSYNSFKFNKIFEIKSVPSFFQKLLTLLKISFFLLISWWFYRQ